MDKNNKNQPNKSELIKIIKQNELINCTISINNNLADINAKLIIKEQTMNKEQGFNQTQINQLIDVVRTIIKEEVAPMVQTIIKEEVPPMVEKIVDQKLEPINQRLDIIEQDIKEIKSCPTIQKELNKKL